MALFGWFLLLCALPFSLSKEEELARLKLAANVIDVGLKGISSRWDIDNFPVFLKTTWMLGPAYDLLKDRFQARISTALQGRSPSPAFIISFTGSSVTAGHDSPFIRSYPVLAGAMLKESFSSLGINLTVRNVAMGNNPCLPYDVCVRTFAGSDADIVVWEQSYNCAPSNKGYLYEQFIRQVL